MTDKVTRKREYSKKYNAVWKKTDPEGFRRNARKNRLRDSFRGRFDDEIKRTEERLALLRELAEDHRQEQKCPGCLMRGRLKPSMLMPKEVCPLDGYKDPRTRLRTPRHISLAKE